MLICQKANYMTRMVKNRPCLFNWPLTYKKSWHYKTTSPIVSTLTTDLSGWLKTSWKKFKSAFWRILWCPQDLFLSLVVMDYFRFEIIHVAETIQACKKSWLTKKSKTKKSLPLLSCCISAAWCTLYALILNSF